MSATLNRDNLVKCLHGLDPNSLTAVISFVPGISNNPHLSGAARVSALISYAESVEGCGLDAIASAICKAFPQLQKTLLPEKHKSSNRITRNSVTKSISISWDTPILVVHAESEMNHAELVASLLHQKGYNASPQMIDESCRKIIGLEAYIVILICTKKSMLTGVAWRTIEALKSQEDAIAFGIQYDSDIVLKELYQFTDFFDISLNQDVEASNFVETFCQTVPLSTDDSNSTSDTAVILHYMDMATGYSSLNFKHIAYFRTGLRDSIKIKSTAMSPEEFLQFSLVVQNGKLTRTGALLFGLVPTNAIPAATTRFTRYYGNERHDDRHPTELSENIITQIDNLRDLVIQHTEQRGGPVSESAMASVEYEYPMECVRELIANALVHRDYEDSTRIAYLRVFSNRIEIASPGNWCPDSLQENKIYTLEEVSQYSRESVCRNPTLARILAWTRYFGNCSVGQAYAVTSSAGG